MFQWGHFPWSPGGFSATDLFIHRHITWSLHGICRCFWPHHRATFGASPSCHVEDLTLKTLFLIAAASARRVLELHALCTVPPFLFERPGSYTLTTNPAFLPKTTTEVALSSDMELSAFHSTPQTNLERGLRLMCPVRALRYYLQRTQPLCGTHTKLLVHWDEDRAPCPVSRRWVSSALSEAIRAVYARMGSADEIFSTNPHSVRGVATSRATIT